MRIIEKEIEDVFEVILNPHRDKRGFFMRTYDIDTFKKFGLDRTWIQENHSLSAKKHIIRGLHFQFPPYSEAKLVRVVRGAIFDVYVDLRIDSPTFGRWGAIELTETNKKMVFIPRGFAHGFCTLSEMSEVLYKVDNFYTPESEGGIIWDDPDLSIDWPVKNPILSEKDLKAITFKEFRKLHSPLEV